MPTVRHDQRVGHEKLEKLQSSKTHGNGHQQILVIAPGHGTQGSRFQKVDCTEQPFTASHHQQPTRVQNLEAAPLGTSRVLPTLTKGARRRSWGRVERAAELVLTDRKYPTSADNVVEQQLSMWRISIDNLLLLDLTCLTLWLPERRAASSSRQEWQETLRLVRQRSTILGYVQSKYRVVDAVVIVVMMAGARLAAAGTT